jgi:hypothetical protein
LPDVRRPMAREEIFVSLVRGQVTAWCPWGKYVDINLSK